MSTRTFFTTVILTLLSWSSALALGGQDIHIDNPHDRTSAGVDVVVAGDGTLFASSHSDSLQTALNIYRSVNGGTTWQLWSTLTTNYGDGHVFDAQLAVTGASTGKLLIAWIDRRLDLEASHVRVSSAPVDAEAPTWTDANVNLVASYGVYSPRIDVLDKTGFNDQVCLAWRSDGDVMYATSGDAGATWSTPIVIGTSSDHIENVAVAADNLDVVHAAWTSRDLAAGPTTLHYRRATSSGEMLFNWDTVQDVGQVNRRILRMTMAANPLPGFDGVMVALGSDFVEDPQMWLLDSTDSGTSWTINGFLHYTYPDAVWAESGRRMVARATTDSEVGFAAALFTPGPNGWTIEPMLDHTDYIALDGGHLALDPTRDHAPVVVSLRRSTAVLPAEGGSLWFDAAWRDGPGYGVPEPDFAIRYYGSAMAGAVLPGDLDGDGLVDLVTRRTSSGSVTLLSSYEPGSMTFIPLAFGLDPDTDIALPDVDADGDHEIAFRLDDGSLSVIGETGSYEPGYPRTLGAAAGDGWISAARVTGDDGEDVVLAAGNQVWVVGPGAADRPGFPWTAPPAAGTASGRVALGDVDGDGRMELVAPFTGGVAVIGHDGLLENIIGQGEAVPGSPSLADFDEDGDLEIAIPRADGTVHLVHHDGTVAGTGQWPYDTGAVGLPSQVVLADITGDDPRDLVFMDADRRVHIVARSGNVPAGWPRQLDPATPVMEPIVAMLGPGEPVVAVGGGDGRVRLLTETGTQEGWPRDYPHPVEGSLDGDGTIDLAVPALPALWTLDMGVAVDDVRKQWTMSGFDPGRSGCTEPFTGVVSSTPQAPALSLHLHGATPTPFNPMTTIRFSVPAGATRASLRVYDAAGRLVRTLHRGALTAGDHAVTWRGDDDHGRGVASGVYHCRLVADGQAQSKSLVLVR